MDLDDLKTQKQSWEKQLLKYQEQIRKNEDFWNRVGAFLTANLDQNLSENRVLHELADKHGCKSKMLKKKLKN